MTNFENLSSFLGMITDKDCPECGNKIIEDKIHTQWCSECAWSNDEDLQDLIRIMKQDEPDRQISDGEKDNK